MLFVCTKTNATFSIEGDSSCLRPTKIGLPSYMTFCSNEREDKISGPKRWFNNFIVIFFTWSQYLHPSCPLCPYMAYHDFITDLDWLKYDFGAFWQADAARCDGVGNQYTHLQDILKSHKYARNTLRQYLWATWDQYPRSTIKHSLQIKTWLEIAVYLVPQYIEYRPRSPEISGADLLGFLFFTH